MTQYIDNPFILALTARNLNVDIHRHSAYQLVFSNDVPFTSTINGQLFRNICGFAIKPQIPHLCVAEEGTLSVLNIEPYSAIGLTLSGNFNTDQAYIVFTSAAEINSFLHTDSPSSDIHTFINALRLHTPAIAHDERVTQMVDYIRTNYFERDISPQTFSDFVFLSPSRLASLFKQQTGSSLSKYLLWIRLRHAIHSILSDPQRGLTDVAYDSGFYDLPQFHKYMHAMFGMPPIALKQNSDLIQVY